MGENHRNQKIAILTDTGTSITPFEAKEQGIFLLPLQIVEGLKSYNDLIDLDTEQVYQMIQNHIPLTTSLPSLSVIYETIEQIKQEGYEQIIAVLLTKAISSTASVVKTTANELSIPITLIDTYTSCQIQRHVVYRIKNLINLNLSIDNILSIIQDEINNSSSYILAGDLNHLKRGGRLTPLAASFANMMKIYPILKMDKDTEGKIDVYNKVRTKKKSIRTIIDMSIPQDQMNDYKYFVLHSDDLEKAISIKNELLNKGINEENIVTTHFNSIIAVHVGMKCLAIQHIKINKI